VSRIASQADRAGVMRTIRAGAISSSSRSHDLAVGRCILFLAPRIGEAVGSCMAAGLATSISWATDIKERSPSGRNLSRRPEIEALTTDNLAIGGFPGSQTGAAHLSSSYRGLCASAAMIAMALVCRPALSELRGATTSLDVTIQGPILRLIKDRRPAGMALLMITHDLGGSPTLPPRAS